MDRIIKNYSNFWNEKHSISQLILSIVLLLAGAVATYFASNYTDSFTGYVVPDLLLDHLPVISVGYIFFQGAAIFTIIVAAILLTNPKYFPFVFESSALFFFVRSIFMSMTHLSAPMIEYYSYVQREHHAREILFTISSGNDLFFSGHTGFPALLMFIFWENKYLRYFFLTCSIIGALAVIFGHLHYSIDVFSSYFIAFGVFYMSRILFQKAYGLIKK